MGVTLLGGSQKRKIRNLGGAEIRQHAKNEPLLFDKHMHLCTFVVFDYFILVIVFWIITIIQHLWCSFHLTKGYIRLC
jgi:hypothetical protein